MNNIPFIPSIWEDLSSAFKLDSSVLDKDNINPEHYKLGGIETYDFIAAKLSKEELKGYLKGNILKYISRESEKNGLEDIKKMQWYVNKLVELGE